MSMHLVGPWLTTTGKRKGKNKHRTAAGAKQARENAQAWQELLKKYDVKPSTKNQQVVRPTSKLDPVVCSSPVVSAERSTRHIPSVDTGIGTTAKREILQYTGDKMLGIGVLHKSNSVPIFKQEDAEAISKMRRG